MRLISVREIMEVVSAATCVSVEVMSGDSREARIVEARWLCWWIAREVNGHTYALIGRLSARVPVHHTTVMHGVASTAQRMADEPDFAALAMTLKRTIELLADRNLMRASSDIDAVAVARRVLTNTAFHSVRVSTLEIAALCQLIVGLYGPDDEPSPSLPTFASPIAAETQPEPEYSHG